MEQISVVDADGNPRPTHEIASDFTNAFMNDTFGVPITIAAARLGLELCTLIDKLRGEDVDDDRFYLDDDDICTDPNCMYPH